MLRRLFIALCLLVAASSTVRAEVILGNLAGATDGGNTGLHINIHRGLSFVMGSQDYSLDALLLRLNYLTGTPVVELHSDGGTHPGSLITSFNVPSANGGGIQTYNFTPQSATLLSANTKYWLEVYGATTDPIQWIRPTFDTAPAPTAAASFQDSATFSGGSWSPSLQVNMFQLEAHSAVPEPTSFLLVAGLVAAADVRRRFRKR